MSDSQRVGTDDAVVQAGLSMGTASETKHDAPLHMTPAAMVICLLLAIAGLLLWRDHQAHVLNVLPYLLLLSCPVVHLLMHRGHGHHRHDRGES